MADRRKLLPAWRMIVIAALAGAAAGAVAVYVSAKHSGNGAPAVRGAAAPSDGDALCAAKAGKAKSIADSATGEVAALLPADPPQLLRSLAFNDPAGKPMTLADRAGKTVLLNLWATWCAPCREEMPALDALQRGKGSDRFEVVAVNVDTGSDEKPNTFLEETGVSALARYRDSSLALFNELKARGLALGLPATLLIDGEGCLLAHMNGPANWASADALKFVDRATGG